MKKLGLFTITIIAACLVLSVSCVSPASKHVNQGDAYYQQGQWEQAITEYEEASKIAPSPELNSKLASAYAQQAIVYYDKKEYDKAIADCEKALALLPTVEISPKLAEAYVQRAMTYINSENYDMAISDLSKAIQLDPNSATAYNDRGYAYIKKGDNFKYKERVDNAHLAITDLARAVELNPNIDDKLMLAEAYFIGEQYSKLITYCTKTIERNPEKAIGYYWLGRAYDWQYLCTKVGYDQAIYNFDKAIELAATDKSFPNSRHAEVYALRATIKYTNPVLGIGEITDCNAYLQDLQKAIEIDPSNSSTYYQIMQAVEALCSSKRR